MAETTLAKYKTRILAQMGLTGDATIWDTILTDKLNEAYEDVLLKTRCNVDLAEVSFEAGEDSYELPEGVLSFLTWSTTATNSQYPMESVTLSKIRDMQLNSGSYAGSPVKYYAVVGNTLVVYPTPTSADTLAFDYVPRPTALSAASDTPDDIPQEYHQLLEWYVLAYIGMAEENQASGNGVYWEGKYEKGLRDMRKNLHTKQGIRSPRIRVGSPTYVSRDPSVPSY